MSFQKSIRCHSQNQLVFKKLICKVRITILFNGSKRNRMANSNIDIPGFLRNTLDGGVSNSDAISEEFDNSLSANSTKIRLISSSSENALIISDNGHGMTMDDLEQSCRLHSRTISSSDRHGKFGFGGKQSQMTLTNLEGIVTKFSSIGNGVSQITINFPKILQTGIYYPQAHGIVSDDQHIWDKYTVNPIGSGTVIYMRIPQFKRTGLNDAFINETVAGLRFKYGTTYREALEKGVELHVIIDDFECQIHPIDRMCTSWIGKSLPHTIQFNHESHEIQIMQNTTNGEIVAHHLSDGIRMHLDNFQKLIQVSEELMSSLEYVGSTKCSFAYSNEWNELQKDDLEKNGITPLHKGQTGVKTFRTQTNGTELVRNGKVIKHFPTKEKKSGDHDLGLQIAQTRTRIEFVASEQMDTIFKVQVNKSQVNEELIDQNVWKTIDRLRQTFINTCHKTIKSLNDSSKIINDHQFSESESEYVLSQPQSRSPSPSPSNSIERLVPVIDIKTRNTKSASKSKIVGLTNPLMSSQKSETYESGDLQESSDTDEEIITNANEITDVPNIAPDSVREVGPSVHESIVRGTGEKILEEWSKSGQYMTTFEETLNDMITSYQDGCRKDQAQYFLKHMKVEQKHDLIIDLMKIRHPLPEDRMFKGIELQRTYREKFGTDAVVGL